MNIPYEDRFMQNDLYDAADRTGQTLVLVTGATGNVGRNVVSQLLDRGIRVRALTRNPHVSRLPRGVEVVCGDFSVPDTLKICVDSIEAVFLLWQPALATTAPALLEALAKHARRVVFLSSAAVRDYVDQQSNVIGAFHAGFGGGSQSGLGGTDFGR